MSETLDTVEIVRHRLADGRTIADADVHELIAEIDRLRDQVRKSGVGLAFLASKRRMVPF